MQIKFFCPNGHKLKAEPKLGGKSGICPKCDVKVEIPEPIEKRISDSSIVAALGDYIPETRREQTKTEAPQQSRRVCPKCQNLVLGAYRVCPTCKIYLPNEVVTG